MDQVRISCHADLQALQDVRSDEQLMSVELVSLESLSVASDSYALLRSLIERGHWRCPQIDVLSLVAGVAVELHKLKHDLFPLVQEAKLGEGFPEALLLLKNSGTVLEGIEEEAVKKCVKGSLVEEFFVQAGAVGSVLRFDFDQVLNGTRKFAWFQSRVPPLLDEVDERLSTPVYFRGSE